MPIRLTVCWVLLAWFTWACGGRSGIEGLPLAAGCPGSLLACGEPATCVDTRFDPEHCGDCKTACAATEFCAQGKCTRACQGDECECGGHACCAAPFVACDGSASGACTDLQSDREHCGSCEHRCAASEPCVDGVCARQCHNDELGCTDASGQFQCVTVSDDPNNCGACGNHCPPGAKCEAGDCRCDGHACCEAPLLSCASPSGERCVDPATDRAHCGDCATRCADGQGCASGTCSKCSPSYFFTPVAYPSGALFAEHSEPVVHDLDQDGLLDVVIPDSAASTLSVFFGTGAGKLSKRLALNSVPNPIAAGVADLNQDGNEDIVALGTGFLDIHWGASRPPFAGAQRFAIDEDWNVTAPLAFAIADVEADSAPEMIVVTRTVSGGVTPYRLHVWLVSVANNAVFSATLVYEDLAEPRAPKRIQAIDLNGDGLLDIALLSSTVHALMNNGDGTFQFVENWSGPATGLLPQRLLDVNGDQRLDLLSAERTGQGTLYFGYYLRVALGNALGGFDLRPRPASLLSNAAPGNLGFADLNGDGALDVVAREGDNNVVSVALGNGAGGFADPPQILSNIAAGTASFALADLDADGQPDLIAAHESTSALTVHRGRTDATFESYMLSLPAETFLRSAVLLPRAGTSPAILVVGGLDTGQFRVLVSDGNGGVTETQRSGIYRPLSLSLADLDGDGLRDVVVPAERAVYWLRNLGAERFADPALVVDGFRATTVLSGNFDGDKQDELVFSVISNQVDIVKRNPLDQTFSETRYPVGNFPSLAVGDVDGDRRADLIVASADSPFELTVWLGSQTGPFQPNFSAPIPDAARVVSTPNLAGGSGSDVFVGHDSGYVVFGLGSPGVPGSPGELTPLASGSAPIVHANSLFVDVDRDGVPDLLAGFAAGNLGLWRGFADGHLEQSEPYLVPGAYRPLGLGDFDQDGLDDLLLYGGSQYNASLIVLRGAVRCK